MTGARIDFRKVSSEAAARAETIVRRWLPDGHREGPEWVARNPRRDDRHAGSFKVNLRTGAWGDFATGDKGGDLISLAAFLFGLTHADAADSPSAGDGRRRTPQRDTLIGLTERCDLWHDSYRTAFVTFPVNAHRENWPVRSREFRMWLSSRFFEETGAAIGGQALEDGIHIVEARAVNDGPEHVPATRVGRARDRLYLDLGDASWRAVEIDANGWHVVKHPPIKLVRSVAMRPLPEPEAGGTIEEQQFLNVRDEASFMLVAAWLVAALRERGPYPVLVLNGEQGSGKSMFTRYMRALIDPSAAPIRAVPKDDRDLVVSAGNSWVLAFDNLSSVPIWLADALCRLATGGGFATRMLHADREETIFEASRPIILNGIPSLTDRADLADRAVCIHLAAISDGPGSAEHDRQGRRKRLGAAASGRLRLCPSQQTFTTEHRTYGQFPYCLVVTRDNL